MKKKPKKQHEPTCAHCKKAVLITQGFQLIRGFSAVNNCKFVSTMYMQPTKVVKEQVHNYHFKCIEEVVLTAVHTELRRRQGLDKDRALE